MPDTIEKSNRFPLRPEGYRLLFSQGYELPIFPCAQGTKVPIAGFNLQPVLRGEIPPDESLRAFEGQTSANYGVACRNGKFAFDFENIEQYHQFFPQYQQLEAATMCVRTAHGGVHVWLQTSEDIPRKLGIAEEILDLLGVGGYAIGPGSIIDHVKCEPSKSRCPHTGSSRYEVIDSHRMMNADTLLPGGGIVDAIMKRAKSLGWQVKERRQENAKELLKGVKEGGRNQAAFKVSRFLLFYQELAEADAWFLLHDWNQHNTPPLDERELKSCFESAKKYPRPSEEQEPATIRIPGRRRFR